MRLAIVAVGSARGALGEAITEYETRAGRYWKLDAIEVRAGAGGSRDAGAVMDEEERRIRARLPKDLDVVALTRAGDPMDSRGLARYLEQLGVRSRPGATFVLGGAFGLSEALLSDAQRCMSLSAMTLPHEMARLLLAEQLYRAGTIVRGEPYHKA